MSRNDVNISMNAQAGGARAQFQSIIATLSRMDESLRRVSQSSARTATNTRKQIGGMQKTAMTAATSMRNLLGIGSGGAALLTTIQLIRSELEAVKQLHDSMKTESVKTGEATDRFVGNLPPGVDMTPTEVVQMAQSSDAGIRDLSQIIDLMTAGVSAGEGGDARARAQGVADSADLIHSYDEDTQLEAVQAAVAVTDAFGGSFEDRMAQLKAALSASPSATDVGPFFKSLAQATVALKSNYGIGFEEGLARLVTFQQMARDTSGQVSSTGVTKTEGQLYEQFVKRDISEEEVPPAQRLPFVMGDDPRAAKIREELLGIFDKSLSEVQRNLKTMGPDSEMRGAAENRQKNLMTMRALLQARHTTDVTDQTNAQNRFFQNRDENIPTADRAAEVVRQREAEKSSDPVMGPVELQREMDRTFRLTRNDTAGALRSQLAKVIEENQVAFGGTALETKIKTFLARVQNINSDDETALREMKSFFEDERRQLGMTADAGITDAVGAIPFLRVGAKIAEWTGAPVLSEYNDRPKRPDEFTEKDVTLARAMDGMINRLDEILSARQTAEGEPVQPMGDTSPGVLLQPITDDQEDLSKAARALWRSAEGYPGNTLTSAERAGEAFRDLATQSLENAMARPLTDKDEKGLEASVERVEAGYSPELSLQEIITRAGLPLLDQAGQRSGIEAPVDRETVEQFNESVGRPTKEDPKKTAIPLSPGAPEQAKDNPKPKPEDSAKVTRVQDTDVIQAIRELNETMKRALAQSTGVGRPVLPPLPMPGNPGADVWGPMPTPPGYDPPPVNEDIA